VGYRALAEQIESLSGRLRSAGLKPGDAVAIVLPNSLEFLVVLLALTLTGRIKDLINRGVEKISPEEVEAVLLEDPPVAEAAVFGVPDPKYGEEVAAAVVLHGNCDAIKFQEFCMERLAVFKVPKFIHITSALPKNVMGKIKRRDVAERFKEFKAPGAVR